MRIGRHVSALAVVGLLAAGTFAGGEATADCAAPWVSWEGHQKVSAAPGDTLILTGRYFADRCNDTCTSSFGCTNCGPPAHPIQDMTVEAISEDGTKLVLAEVDAGDDFRLRAEIVLPADLTTGRYEVRVEQAYPPLTMLVSD